MRKIIFLVLLALLNGMNTESQTMHIATFNIRYDNPRDSGNLWKDRKDPVTALIRYHNFDVVGVQEALKNQLDDMQAGLKGYVYHGVGRDDGKAAGEHSAIFYKNSKYTMGASGDFWLSTTPEKVGPGWDAKLNRICSWVKLTDKKSGKEFFVFNAHYDHQGVQARVESSKLILEKIKSIAGDKPVVFMGDLNGNRESEWYRHIASSGILKDSHGLAKLVYQPNGSFSSFRADGIRNDVIDHVFVSSHFKASKWAVLTDTYFGKFPSDHFPVAVQLSIQ
jgi:endonuclease/exonuclease/phosphatase family metal-dependent hydrolase